MGGNVREWTQSRVLPCPEGRVHVRNQLVQLSRAVSKVSSAFDRP